MPLKTTHCVQRLPQPLYYEVLIEQMLSFLYCLEQKIFIYDEIQSSGHKGFQAKIQKTMEQK
jgi:hypothetical protein